MKYNLLILLVLCLFFNVESCYAYTFNWSLKTTGTGGDENSNNEPLTGSFNMSDFNRNGYSFSCSYKYTLDPNGGIEINVFNQENNLIMGDDTLRLKESIKAGTGVGISIYEKVSVSWNIEVEVVRKSSCYVVRCSDTGESYRECGEIEELPRYCTYYREGSKILTSGNEYDECVQRTDTEIRSKMENSISSSSFLRLKNANDVLSDETVSISAEKDCERGENKYTCTYTYLPNAVCMNKVTAEVRYSKDGNCDLSKEFVVGNDSISGKEHFHYFVPMNVTNGEFSLILSNKNEVKAKEWCLAAIDYNRNTYFEHLYTNSNKPVRLSERFEIAKTQVSNGCLYMTEIKIPVSEGIYAVNSQEKISGFNFYVRNIDERDPFPVPVNDINSLWYDWYQNNYNDEGKYGATNMAPNIRNSFNEISYKAENIKSSDIKNYNSNKSYLNNSLNYLGKSEFITNNSIFSSYVSPGYRVGCGPLNIDKQEGCK